MAGLIHMQGLRRLHEAMRAAGDQRARFQITHNRIVFDCLFLTDIAPFEFVLAAIGHPDVALVLHVRRGYLVVPNFGDGYKPLARLFHTGEETFRPFKPAEFLCEIDRDIPTAYRKPTHIETVRTYRHHVEEGDKPYFFGWLDNNPQGRRVSPENLDKTRRCFGERVRDICERTNQSSRWTADRASARDYFEPRR